MQKDHPDFAEGGDPPCWAHLFDEEVGGEETASLYPSQSESRNDDAEETVQPERREIAR